MTLHIGFTISTVIWQALAAMPDQNGIWMLTLSRLMLYQGKKGNVMFGTTYASYVTKMDTCQKNVRIGSITKEDLVKESTRESIRKESDSPKEAIFEPQKWMAVPKKKKKKSQSLANQTRRK